MGKLTEGETIRSSQKNNQYKIRGVLGEGGFGCAYRAEATVDGSRLADDVCLKITKDLTSWHRESYFGELLQGKKRAIEMRESFVLAPKKPRRGQIHYCIVQELAEHGDLLTYLNETRKAWEKKRVKREVGALLKLLDELHGGSATHRDITPMNIFVCRNGRLKLGDFGIARHELAGSLRTITAFNPWFAPTKMLDRVHPRWEACDDVYQMGHLMAMLLSGEVEEKLTIRSVSRLECDEQTKDVIKRAIGPRKDRYVDAYEMLEALEGKEGDAKPPLRSVKGKKVVFTGRLSIKRFDAEVLALQAGGTVRRKMSPTVNILVQGGRSRLYKKGHKGRKLLEAERLIKKGRKIYIIGEREFRQLVRKKG
jgi:serine/threonine protein kinase